MRSGADWCPPALIADERALQKRHSLNLFTDASGFPRGRPGCPAPCERRFLLLPHRLQELMSLVEGEVTLIHERARPVHFHAFDVNFAP